MYIFESTREHFELTFQSGRTMIQAEGKVERIPDWLQFNQEPCDPKYITPAKQ